MVDTLNNLDTMGVQRTKINGNFVESLNTDISLSARLDLLEEKVGASAYIRTGTTACAVAGNWYPISGAFTNKVLECFSLNVDKLVYDCLQTLEMEVLMQISAQSDKQGSMLTFAVEKNGVIIAGSDAPREFSVGTTGSLGTVTTVNLAQNDEIQLVVKSDTANTEVSHINLGTTLKRFF